MFAVLFQSGGSDQLDLASGQRWLQDIGCIQCTFRTAGTDNSMNLINEQQDSLMFFYFLDHILDTFLKFTPVLASCNHAGKIQNNKALLFHCIRNHSHNDTLGKSLYDCSLTNTWFTYQARVVLSSSAQNLDQSGNLFLTSHYRVKLSLGCKLCQITAVLVQSRGACCSFIFCILCVLKFFCNRVIVNPHCCQDCCKKFLDIYSHCKQQSGGYTFWFFQKCK